MKLKIEYTEDNKFLKVLEFMDHMFPFSELRRREIEVFALILEYNYKYKDYPDKEKIMLLDSPEVRKEIANRLGINIRILYTLTSSLKSKGFIGNYNMVNETYKKTLIDAGDELIINFIKA